MKIRCFSSMGLCAAIATAALWATSAAASDPLKPTMSDQAARTPALPADDTAMISPRRAPDVVDQRGGEPEVAAAGKRILMRDLPPSKRPVEGEPKRFHIQGDIGELAGRAPDKVTTFRKVPTDPPSALPVETANRGAGDAIRIFNATDSSDTNSIPPDMVLATGPTHVMQAINSGFEIYTKLGAVEQEYVSFADFFPEPNDEWEGRIFDPRLLYDSIHDKYVLMALGKDDENLTSYIFIAVSETSDPTGYWCKRQINATDNSGTSTAWLDFASLGTDANGVYVTGNYKYFSGGHRGAALRSYRIGMMTGCDGVGGWKFRDVEWPNGADADSLQPAQAHTINSDDETFFVNTYPLGGNEVMLTRLSGDRGNAPTLSKSVISIPTHDAILGNVDQPGNPVDIDGGKSKPLSAVYANRRVFFTLTDDVMNDGSASGWRTVRLNTDSSTMEWTHLLWSGEGIYLFYPAMTLQGTGVDNNLAIFGSWTDAETALSSITRFPSGLFKLYDDQGNSSSGTFTGLVGGTDDYVVLDRNDKNRWGDYSGASYDWTCNNAWGTVQSSTGETSWKTSIVARQFGNELPCPLLYVNAPTELTSWDSGALQTVTWSAAGLPSEDEIYVILLAEGLLQPLSDPLPSTRRSLQFTVPELTSDALIFVGSWDGNRYTVEDWSETFSIVDRIPPTPSPLTWQNPPQPQTSNSMQMRVFEASDGSVDPLNYSFDFTSSPNQGSGGTDSGWVLPRDYVDGGLQPNRSYCYRARARDSSDNRTGFTSVECSATLADEPTAKPFSFPTGSSIDVNWGMNGNPADTFYQVRNITMQTDSGWILATRWRNDGLAAGQTFSYQVRARNRNGIETSWVPLGSATTLLEDDDSDGVIKPLDNCSIAYNPQQRDTDGDGYGNACDADLTQNCVVNAEDLGALRLVFLTNDPHADFNGDGNVNFIDLGIMRLGFFGAPGPSGTTFGCPPAAL